jgi:beta-galactosidase GanA
MTQNFFPVGASYYPPHHPPEDWARDVAGMAEAGMTCFRSAELLASWDYIEKVRGEPDWSWVDALFEQAQQQGMRVLLGTGSASPPIWLLDLYPDVQIRDREDRPFPTGTVWGWASRHHPGYRAEVERYLRLLVERYCNHPALWAWQIDNEPGYPFITRHGEVAPRIHDYNPHTAAAFREWLQRKYGTLEVLNVAWRWDCTHHQYADWRQVQPPRSMPQEWGVVTAWLDWRTFLNEQMAVFIRWQHEIIRSLDTQHPTMTNIFAFSGREVEMALDPWLMASQADAIGYDMYPGIGQRLHRDPAYISLFLDIGRSTALHANKEFWLPELESGPINGWALGPDYTTTPNDILRYNLEALGHGAKAILYQGYREWPCIPIHWGALADFEGKPTRRYAAARTINEMVREHAALFHAAQPPRAEVALFLDTRNTTLLHGMGAMSLMERCVRGAYKTLWGAGYPLEFVNSSALIANLHQYKVVLLPAALLIGQETADALRQFVANGGTLIGFAKCAWVDSGGWSWARQPGAGLEDLFGVQAEEIVRDEHCAITLEESTIGTRTVKGYWHRQALIAQQGAEVLGHFADGSAAIVRQRTGQGSTVYVGTHLDAAALDDADSARLLLALVQQANVRPALQMTATPSTVDGHTLTHEQQRLVILTNNGSETAKVELRGLEATNVRELLAGAPLTVGADNTIAIQLEPWGGAVLHIT